MAENKQETKQTSTKSSTVQRVGNLSISYVMNLLAYGAVLIGGMALFITMILGKVGVSVEFVSTMEKIANSVGWIVLCLLSTRFALRSRKLVMWIIWIVAVAMIVTGIILI